MSRRAAPHAKLTRTLHPDYLVRGMCACVYCERQGPIHNQFDLNSGRKNFEQVFGTNPWVWFLPVRSTPGDGTSFPIVPHDFERNPVFANANDDTGAFDLSDDLSGGGGGGRWGRGGRANSSAFDDDTSGASEEEDWRQRR
jgi:hypothetical protein